MSTLPKAIYTLKAIPIKIPMAFFTEREKKKNPKICIEPQKISNSQSNPEKEVKGITLSDLKLYYEAIIIRTILY